MERREKDETYNPSFAHHAKHERELAYPKQGSNLYDISSTQVCFTRSENWRNSSTHQDRTRSNDSHRSNWFHIHQLSNSIRRWKLCHLDRWTCRPTFVVCSCSSFRRVGVNRSCTFSQDRQFRSTEMDWSKGEAVPTKNAEFLKDVESLSEIGNQNDLIVSFSSHLDQHTVR